ncbi:MAG: lipid-transfer protein [Deltaproteobacteria bacterium]|nr:MAG: lipid-transfer protein [Deltaproteobacteria bacterium]
MSSHRLRDQAAIVGIGQTPYSKGLGRSEFDMAVEAILTACADAGIAPREIDGVVRYDMETTDEEQLLSVVGPGLRYQASTSWGGGGSVSVLVHAALAIAMGMANHVLVFRSRARGKKSVFGKDSKLGGRYWERIADRLPDLTQWHIPHGLVSAFQEMAMITRRHMIEYGTTEEQFAEVAVAMRRHALRNPNAVMRAPMTIADHHSSRMIAEPLRLFDCNIETDGACALIVSSRERARDLRQPPALIHAGALSAGSHHMRLATLFARDRDDDSAARAGRQLWESSGLRPSEIDAFFCYDFFTSFVIIALEDYGFCKRGEGGPFVEDQGLYFEGGRLATNTNGGQLSEAFIHGMNNNLEAVRQIRGTSTSQVPDCELVLLAGANTDPTGAVILRREA